MSILSERLKQTRLDLHYTQKQVAEACGLTKNAITNYESGFREPSIDVLIKLCNYLDVSADYLIGRVDY